MAGGIIPSYRAVVFDEAHEVEEVASQYFGIAISSYQFEELIRDISRILGVHQLSAPSMDRALDQLGRSVEHFLSLLPNVEGRAGLSNRKQFLERNRDDYHAVAGALELAESIVANAPLAVRASLRAVDRIVATEDADAAGWEATQDALAAITGSEDLREGLDAFFEKRSPNWRGR